LLINTSEQEDSKILQSPQVEQPIQRAETPSTSTLCRVPLCLSLEALECWESAPKRSKRRTKVPPERSSVQILLPSCVLAL